MYNVGVFVCVSGCVRENLIDVDFLFKIVGSPFSTTGDVIPFFRPFLCPQPKPDL